MKPTHRPIEIGILCYPQAQLAAVHGLTDLFSVAGRLVAAKGGGAIRLSHWARGDDDLRVHRVFDSLPAPSGEPDVVILPPSLAEPASAETAGRFTAWLAQRHAGGAVLASVCAGAFVLAETGLLAGRPATTHWSHAEGLARRFPAIKVHADKLIVDDGELLTAGGVMAWTDLGLHLIDRLLGPSVMLQTAKFMLIDPPGREQSYYGGFAPPRGHGDALVLGVQDWLETQSLEVDPETMAERAGLNLSVFARRFEAATGLTPQSYDRRLRVNMARDVLSQTDERIETVATSMGFADVGSFARLFSRVMGLSPTAYRRRFEARAIFKPLE